MVLRGQDDEGRDSPAKGIYSLDHPAIRGRNHHAREDDAHHEPSLVEVIDIVIYNTVLDLNIPNKGKPLANNLWILALGPR